MTTTRAQTAPPAELAPQYRAADVEPSVRQRWDEQKAWHAEPPAPASGGSGQAPYAIVIPPPNVTAALHMGHALNNTLQDVLVRYHRMLGDNAMWMPGTDHAGIATQTVVEKRVLQEEGKRRTDFERDAFIAKIQAWKDEYEARILGQLQAMGCSCDWDRTRFTMDDVCAKAVREAFFRLFKDGLIYRGKRLVNWDPVTQTALADDEVEMEEIDGNFYYLKYPLAEPASAGGPQYVTVATTRPETMLGDTAVAVNPKDPRAAALRGKFVKLPLVDRVIPIIEDEYVTLPAEDASASVDPKAKYSSGFLKVTPAHDPNDWELGRKHNLAVINIMAPDASISLDHGWAAQEPTQKDNAELQPFLGLSREDARKAIVRWFKEHDLFEEVKPYRHSVGHSYRSHVPVEPYLSDQWYIAVKKQIPTLRDEGVVPGTDVPANSLAGFALRALAEDQRTGDSAVLSRGQNLREDWEGKLSFTPDRYAKTFETWHENIRDWCISRQLWWGHRIPVWSHKGYATDDFEDNWHNAIREGRVATTEENDVLYVSVRHNDAEIARRLEDEGFIQDSDVLDTWFSSGLWPMSTMGWPERTPELETWNPTNVLCTAREIITLWVSRMVMFNLYFLNRLPFNDVFIHAMIQDGHGQKMSKSLGNGVDPIDIIHSHGSDAMRFTLCAMTTHTQDVRMPVDMVDPFTGESFTPQFVSTAGGKVAAPIQERNGNKFASSYGASSGQVKPSDNLPVARNTSEKFDYGRNFANKLWNAVRFALTTFGAAAQPPASPAPQNALADRWVLSRLARTIHACDAALNEYRFADYAQTLYDFFWRDLCDWYIEAVKPTVADDQQSRGVLAACLDASLRLLHPVMPFITERLWTALNGEVPQRGVPGLALPASDLLMLARWPQAGSSLIDEEAETTFGLVQDVVSGIRNVRTTYKIPPRQKVEVSAKAPPALAQTLLEHRGTIETLAGVAGREIGPNVERPTDAAVAVVRDVEFYVHGLVDVDTERQRLQKRLAELEKQVATLRGRLSNESYISKAPAKLVQQSRDQLTSAEREADSVRNQLAAL